MRRDVADLDDAWLEMGLEEVTRGMRPSTPRAQPRRLAALVPAAVLAVGLAVVALVAWRARGSEPVRPARAGAAPSGDEREVVHLTASGARPAEPLAVLVVDDEPRWTYRYATAVLLRGAGVRLQAFVLQAPPGFTQAHSRDVPALAELPEPRDLGRYDVVLLGDVTPRALAAAGRDPVEFALALAAFTTRGGGLGVLCGPNGMPIAWQGSALQDVLPVVAAARAETPQEPMWLEVTAAGGQHPLLRTASDGTFDADAWTAVSRIPVHCALAAAPRPDADVLLRARSAPERPLLVAGARGRGRVVLVGIEDLWRLREPASELHERLLANLVRWLAAR